MTETSPKARPALVLLLDKGSDPRAYESHKAQCEASGVLFVVKRVDEGAAEDLVGLAEVLNASHVMVVPPDAGFDPLRVETYLAAIAAHPEAVIGFWSANEDARYFELDGTPDANGKSARDRAAEDFFRAKLADPSNTEFGKMAPAIAWCEHRAAFLNDLFSRIPKRPLRWWEAPEGISCVGSILPGSAIGSLLSFAGYSEGDFDDTLRQWATLSGIETIGARLSNPWETVYAVNPKKWNLEATYRAARGGAEVSKTPAVAILTPAYGGVHSSYMRSYLAVGEALRKKGVSVATIITEGESLVTRARHNLVHMFLTSTATHMLFWDADLECLNPEAVGAMLDSGHAVVGGAYPFRDGSGRVVCNFLETDESGAPLPLGTHEERKVSLTVDAHGCAEVRHIPTGFLLVERSAIIELYEAHPELLYQDTSFQPGLRGTPRWDVFGTAIMDRNYISEDWAFCERWRALSKGKDDARHKVFAYVNVDFVHHGVTGSRGSLRAMLSPKESGQ